MDGHLSGPFLFEDRLLLKTISFIYHPAQPLEPSTLTHESWPFTLVSKINLILDGQADDSSSLSSNQDEPVPVRQAPLANQKTEPSPANQNTVGKVPNQEQSPSPNVAIVEFKNEEINK